VIAAVERPPRVVVLGAAGGCGATTLAGALALAWARAGLPSRLIELDLERGDLAGAWGLPADRSLADLLPVLAELEDEHVERAAYPHASGCSVLLAPGVPGAAGRWDEVATSLLLAVASAGVACAIDGGAGLSRPSAAAAALGGSVLIACPPTLAGARRARRLAQAAAAAGCAETPRLVVTLARGEPELGARALAGAAGLAVAAVLPRSDREAARLSAGDWPQGRRTPLARALAELAAQLA
jgi:pilus assembly protein CpaE